MGFFRNIGRAYILGLRVQQLTNSLSLGGIEENREWRSVAYEDTNERYFDTPQDPRVIALRRIKRCEAFAEKPRTDGGMRFCMRLAYSAGRMDSLLFN